MVQAIVERKETNATVRHIIYTVPWEMWDVPTLIGGLLKWLSRLGFALWA